MPLEDIAPDKDAAVQLVLGFVNTHAGGRSERLGDAAGLQDWLEELGIPDARATDADAATGRELRQALQTLMGAHAGTDGLGATIADAEAHLDRLGARLPMSCVVTVAGVTWKNALVGPDAAYASVLSAVNDLATRGLWTRMKACQNDICREGFVDRSRNGSALYHHTNCASMVSMRAYRQRKRDAAT